jgi:DNA-binding protein HU-beta
MPTGRSEIIGDIARSLNVPTTTVADVVTAYESAIIDVLRAGDSVRLTGFLTLESVERPARTGRNPRTGEPLQIPAGRVPKVTVSSAVKSAVKESRP